MSSDVVLTVARVVRDRSWTTQESSMATELATELHRQAAARGLTVQTLTDLGVVASESGTWARFTLQATAA